jgi:hypothetical protein
MSLKNHTAASHVGRILVHIHACSVAVRFLCAAVALCVAIVAHKPCGKTVLERAFAMILACHSIDLDAL